MCSLLKRLLKSIGYLLGRVGWVTLEGRKMLWGVFERIEPPTAWFWERCLWGKLRLWNQRQSLNFFNPFTPKSDQLQISPAASPEIKHHLVWRTWLFIAYAQMKDDYTTNSHFITKYISLQKVGRMHFLNPGVKGWMTIMIILCYSCRDKLLPESAIRNVIYQILQGMAFIHKHGKCSRIL